MKGGRNGDARDFEAALLDFGLKGGVRQRPDGAERGWQQPLNCFEMTQPHKTGEVGTKVQARQLSAAAARKRLGGHYFLLELE